MQIPIFQVDAFTDCPFGGNPAAICPLETWLPDATLQSIAAENNLSETAYFVSEGDRYRLRWFTPSVEVDLCGHATLASAFVLFHSLGFPGNAIHFETRSGTLIVTRKGELLEMDFPSRPPLPCDAHADLIAGLGVAPIEVHAARDYLCVYRHADDVRALDPDFERLKRIDRFAVIATAPGDGCDFVSRFFAPSQGINEDPVTGSAHCTLIPYWAKRLGKSSFFARQVSARGGELFCELRGERVSIAGKAVLYLEGKVTL